MPTSYVNKTKNIYKWPTGYWNAVQLHCDKLVERVTSLWDIRKTETFTGWSFYLLRRLDKNIKHPNKNRPLKHHITASPSSTNLSQDSLEYAERVIEEISSQLETIFCHSAITISRSSDTLNDSSKQNRSPSEVDQDSVRFHLPFIDITIGNMVAVNGYVEHLFNKLNRVEKRRLTDQHIDTIKSYFMIYGANYYLTILTAQASADKKYKFGIPPEVYSTSQGRIKDYQKFNPSQRLIDDNFTQNNPFLMKFIEHAEHIFESIYVPVELRIHYLVLLIKLHLQNQDVSLNHQEKVDSYLRWTKHLIGDEVNDVEKRKKLSEYIYHEIVKIYDANTWRSLDPRSTIDDVYNTFIVTQGCDEELLPLKILQSEIDSIIESEIRSKILWPFSVGYNYLLNNLPIAYIDTLTSQPVADLIKWRYEKKPTVEELVRILSANNSRDALTRAVIGKLINIVCRGDSDRIIVFNQLIAADLLSEDNIHLLISINKNFLPEFSTCVSSLTGHKILTDSNFKLIAGSYTHAEKLSDFLVELKIANLLAGENTTLLSHAIENLDELIELWGNFDDGIQRLAAVRDSDAKSVPERLHEIESIAAQLAQQVKWKLGGNGLKLMMSLAFGIQGDYFGEPKEEITAALLAIKRVKQSESGDDTDFRRRVSTNYAIYKQALLINKFMKDIIRLRPRVTSFTHRKLIEKHTAFVSNLSQMDDESIKGYLKEFLQCSVIEATDRSPVRMSRWANKARDLLNGKYSGLKDWFTSDVLDKKLFLTLFDSATTRPFSQTSESAGERLNSTIPPTVYTEFTL